jgi:hypothetical protein
MLQPKVESWGNTLCLFSGSNWKNQVTSNIDSVKSEELGEIMQPMTAGHQL